MLPDLMWIIVLRGWAAGDFYFGQRAPGEYNPAMLD